MSHIGLSRTVTSLNVRESPVGSAPKSALLADTVALRHSDRGTRWTVLLRMPREVGTLRRNDGTLGRTAELTSMRSRARLRRAGSRLRRGPRDGAPATSSAWRRLRPHPHRTPPTTLALTRRRRSWITSQDRLFVVQLVMVLPVDRGRSRRRALVAGYVVRPPNNRPHKARQLDHRTPSRAQGQRSSHHWADVRLSADRRAWAGCERKSRRTGTVRTRIAGPDRSRSANYRALAGRVWSVQSVLVADHPIE